MRDEIFHLTHFKCLIKRMNVHKEIKKRKNGAWGGWRWQNVSVNEQTSELKEKKFIRVKQKKRERALMKKRNEIDEQMV